MILLLWACFEYIVPQQKDHYLMSRSVSQEKVDHLFDHMEEHVPDLQIIYKDEDQPGIWLKIVAFFIWFVGLFSSFDKQWNNSIGNAMLGKYILLPGTKRHRDFTNLRTYTLLRHEYTHILDQRRRPFWFNLTYVLLPLPFLFSGRAHWEYRAFSQEMLAYYENTGRVHGSLVEGIKDQFTSSLYLWMWIRSSTVDRKVDELVEMVENEEISGYAPDISFM